MNIRINNLLLTCLALLPLVSTKNFPLISVIVRLLFIFSGALAFNKIINRGFTLKSKDLRNLLKLFYIHMIFISLGGLIVFDFPNNYVNGIATIMTIFCAIQIIIISKCFGINWVKGICNIVLFYSVDLIFESYIGFNFLGGSSIYSEANRVWGIFGLSGGTPPPGTFIVFFLFVPFFVFRKRTSYIYFLTYLLGIIRSGDRSPFLILIFSLIAISIPEIVKLFKKSKISYSTI